MHSKRRSDEKEFIMGTHIAGVFPKYFAGWEWGFFGRGKVEHVWAPWFESSFMVHKSSCVWAGVVAIALKIHLNTANSIWRFGCMLVIYLFTSDTEQVFIVRLWDTWFIPLGFLYQNYILSSVCNVTYKWKFAMMTFFLILKAMDSSITLPSKTLAYL